MIKNWQIRVLISLSVLMLTAAPVFATPKYTFEYSTVPGEIIEYTGEVATTVRLPWLDDSEAGRNILYYLSTLTTKIDENNHGIIRVEDTTITMPNGEKVTDQVTYRVLAPDFAYLDTPGGLLTGIDFFPPIPVSVGMSWQVTAELAIPYLNTVLPLTTTYYLQEVISVGRDEVGVIRQYTELEHGTVDYLDTEMDMGLEVWGTLIWSLGTGDYVGSYVLTDIVLELPVGMGDGKMVTTVSRSEVIQSSNALPEPVEKYIAVYLERMSVK